MFKVTDSALERLKQLFSLESSEPDNPLFFRVYVRGGGCSGLQYGFGFEQQTLENDTVISEQENIPIRIDPISWIYLSEATLDYVCDLTGARFNIENPSVRTQCHCGSSFSL